MQGLPSHSREQVVCDEVDARGAVRCAGGQAMARCSGLIRGFAIGTQAILTQLEMILYTSCPGRAWFRGHVTGRLERHHVETSMGLFLLWVIFQVCRCTPDAQVWPWCRQRCQQSCKAGWLSFRVCHCVCAMLATPFLLPPIWQSTRVM